MKDDSDHYTSLAFAACAALAVGSGVLMGLAGCGSDSGGGGDDGPDPGQVALHESRSSTIALADDGSRVAMVNPDDGSLSVFATADHTRLAKVATGKNPSSVVMTADGKSAFVANRADGTVVRIAGLDGGTPAIDATIEVGSEPVALALSPTGAKLFVAEFAESRISVIDTASLQIIQTFALDRPRALLVTNNGDTSDDDERLAVTQFYGTPVPGREAKDDGRIGRVRLYSLADLAQYKDITLAPIDSGFPCRTIRARGSRSTPARDGYFSSAVASAGSCCMTSFAAATARFSRSATAIESWLTRTWRRAPFAIVWTATMSLPRPIFAGWPRPSKSSHLKRPNVSAFSKSVVPTMWKPKLMPPSCLPPS